LRSQKLAALLTYCYESIPYYREQFKAIGAEPGDFSNTEDLCRFPILEKETLRDRSEELLNPNADRTGWIKYSSSGSTGIPLQLWYHPLERLRMGHTVTRELLFHGHQPWHSMVNITEPRHSSPKNQWYHRIGLMNEQFLSLYDESGLNLERLRQINPKLLIGFPSVLLLIGEELSSVRQLDWRPQRIFTLAEVLTDEYRQNLQQYWGVDPVDMYGANEVGHIAFQCKDRENYHINADSLHIDIVRDGEIIPHGDLGEVVVTNFDLRVMPIIRYRIGDVARKVSGACSCGCNMPLMGSVAGRTDGFISGDDGKIFSALEVSLILKSVSGVKQFRLIQKEHGRVTVQYKPVSGEVNPELEITACLKMRLGEKMQIDTEKVKDIPREKSGKIRSVISEVTNPYQTE